MDIQVDRDSNLDPLDNMTRAEFKRFAKHYLGKKYDPSLRRDDLTMADGTVEMGLKSMLRREGFTGNEPPPPKKMLLGTPAMDADTKDALQTAEDESRKEAVQSVSSLKWQELRRLAQRLGVLDPRLKRPDLERVVVEKMNGEIAS